MKKKSRSNAKQVPFAGADQMRVLAKFSPGETFVFHTLTRVCAEVLKVDYGKASQFADGLVDAGLVVPAAKIGLTEMQTFQVKPNE